jgi:hypothetical protein
MAKRKMFFMQTINERKKVQWREKNAYLQVVTHDNHCNSHDDDLVATKIHHNAHDVAQCFTITHKTQSRYYNLKLDDKQEENFTSTRHCPS